MKVFLLDPENSYTQQLKDLSCAAMEVRVLTDDKTGTLPRDSLRIDVIVAAGDFSNRSKLTDRLLMWRTHPHTYMIPCYVVADFYTFQPTCLWPRLSIDRFENRIEGPSFCDWLTRVVEWQQNRMHIPNSDTFKKHSVLELISSLSLRRASGQLSVLDEEGSEGSLIFHEGGLVRAALRHTQGEDAFQELLSRFVGSYQWESLNAIHSENGHQPLTYLIEEGLRLLRDANVLYHFLPDLRCPIRRTDSQSFLDDPAVLYYDDLKRLHGLIDGKTTAAELIEASPLSRSRTMSWLAKWFSMGDVEIAGEPVSAEPVADEMELPRSEDSSDLAGGALQESPMPIWEEIISNDAEVEFPSMDFYTEPSVETIVSANIVIEEAPADALEAYAPTHEEGMPLPSLDEPLPEFHITSEETAPQAESADAVWEPGEAGQEKSDDAVQEEPVQTHRLLIVDDSRLMCSALQSIFSKDPRFEIVGVAHDGVEALKLVEEQKPDVVTMDIHMPRMDGLTALKHIMIRDPRPVVVLSAFTKETSELTYESFKYGAVNVFSKPSHKSPQEMEKETKQLRDGVSQASLVQMDAAQYIRRSRKNRNAEEALRDSKEGRRGTESQPPVVAIGCGAGGFPPLLKLLCSLSKTEDLPWMVACMAMPRRVVEAMAPNLAKDCAVKIELASPGAPLEPGVAYLYSHEECLHVSFHEGQMRLDKDSTCPEASRPLDHLLFSMADSANGRTAAFLISGRGDDGLEGLRYVQGKGGMTYALSPNVCLNPDLPRKVLEEGIAKEVRTVVQLASLLEDGKGLIS